VGLWAIDFCAGAVTVLGGVAREEDTRRRRRICARSVDRSRASGYRARTVSAPRPGPERALAVIAERKLALDLGTLDLAFLVALYVRGEGAGLTAFSEAQLEDGFVQACAVVQPEADQLRRRATLAIQRLRDQRLLARVDGQGVVRTGEFALSRLATGIVQFFLEEDVLTRETLGVLTHGLRLALGGVLEAARGAREPAAWQDRVVGPLQVTITELIAGIERRQRGLDLQQEDFQAEIRRVLEADWFAAIDRCQDLLESTSATLRELNEVLLRDTAVLLGLLHDIEELAIAAGEQRNITRLRLEKLLAAG